MANGIYDEIGCVVVYDVELTEEEYELLLEDDELCDEFIEELLGCIKWQNLILNKLSLI